MEKDQTPVQDANANPADGTAQADQTAAAAGEKSAETKEQKPLPAVDYEAKFKASQDEAIRLKKALEGEQERWEKISPVLQTLNDNPDLMRAVDDAYTSTSSGLPNETQTKIIESLVEKKLKDQLAPVRAELDADRRSRVERAFTDFTKRFPDAIEHWDKIERNLQGMKAAGYPLEEGLENAYFLAKKEEAKKAGKKELAFEIYQREQVVASGGSSTGSGADDESAMTADEKKVARELGLKDEEYTAAKPKE